MRRVLLLIVSAATACSAAEAQTTPDAGTSAQTSRAIVWIDQANEPVNLLAADLYFDEQGLVWRIDAESGEITAAIRGTDFAEAWATADCTGESYLLNGVPLPRFTFQMPGEDAIRVRPDNLDLRTVAVCSRRGELGQCIPFANCTEPMGRLPLALTLPAPGVSVPASRPGPIYPTWRSP